MGFSVQIKCMKFTGKLPCILTALSLACEILAGEAPLTNKPTLFIIGDSTVRNGTKGQMGWGEAIAAQFDPAKIIVVNRAIGGRSSRTFLTEGRWAKVLDEVRSGNFV